GPAASVHVWGAITPGLLGGDSWVTAALTAKMTDTSTASRPRSRPSHRGGGPSPAPSRRGKTRRRLTPATATTAPSSPILSPIPRPYQLLAAAVKLKM